MMLPITRRDVLRSTASGFGYLAFSALAHEQARAETESSVQNPLSAKQPHFAPSAKRVIFLSMRGAPSHVDTFDYKPRLNKDDGKPSALGRGGTAAFGRSSGSRLMGSPWEFSQRGESGLWISELLPEIANYSDELCLLNGMHTDVPNHAPAEVQSHTGSFQFVRPSLGAWTLYGLGTENTNLPGFVALSPPAGTATNFGNAFLPAIYQADKIGVSRNNYFRAFNRGAQSPKIANIENPVLDKAAQRRQLDFIKTLNEGKLQRDVYHPEVEGAIESFELAFRMQDELPQLVDIEQESDETMRLYGIDGSETDSFGRQCLMARRLAEAGVRFVELTHQNWDHHRNLSDALPQRCREIDKPIAGLLADLKRRDLLKDTLVVWAGEFGRTPYSQGSDGRDHNHKGYTTWMAGGGVKGGFRYGATDEYGYEAVEGRTHIHDWHATILHLLGLDHERLTYRHAGRDFRLTDTAGRVAKEILA